MKHHFIFTIILISVIAISGCGYKSLNSDYAGPKPLPETISERFSYTRNVDVKKETEILKSKKYTIKRIELYRGPNEPNIIVDYYSVNESGKRPPILVLPILGGDNIVAKKFAAYLAEHNLPGIIVHRKEDFEKVMDINRLDEMSKTIVTDTRKVIDWIETQDRSAGSGRVGEPDESGEMDSSNIGIMGVSLGGISTALITAVEPRIKASLMMMTAGDLPYILSYTKEKKIIEKVNEYRKKNDLSLDQFYHKLKDSISNDPIFFAEYIDARKVLMMLAFFDRVVPYQKGKELREKIGNPETIYLFSGHYSAIVYLPYAKWACLNFFKTRLKI